jgi:branched-chain amino acid transport system substrate-binding protein
MKKIYSLCFFLIGLLFFINGCVNKSEETIEIGVSLPLTGDFASYGKRAQNGIDLAVSEINESDNYGFKIKMNYQDNRGSASAAANVMQRFATIDKLQVVIGGASSMESLAMLPIADANEVVLISPISSSPELSMDDYFFRICPSDAYQAVMMAEWLIEREYNSVAVLYINSNWGLSLKNEFVKNYEKAGGSISIIESMSEGERDFRTQITRITSRNPDAIYCISYGAEGGIILKQLREMGYKKDVFGADVWSSPEFLTSAGSAAEGVYLIRPAEYDGKEFEEFEERYTAKYNENPDVYAAYSYDVVNIIAEALKNTDRTGKKIREFFLKMEGFNGATGITEFDELGDCNTKPFVKLVIKNESITKLK